MIGERIGPYRVIEMVGIGGMGTVWRATDEFLDRDVALKVVRPELLARPGLADRFRAEAIVLARLQHANIGGLYGVERRGDEYVMVMEFVDGRPLDAWLDHHGPFAWSDASRLVRNVLDALEHAHERGVIHRDIKPANVMLTRQGRVKVMDFGIARLVGGQRLTSTGAAVGTPSYMSPEQLLGQEIDGRSDVYAVGTLLFELVTGHVPFELPGDYMRMIAQLQQTPPAPSTMVAALPAGFDALVLRALAKNPEDRWANAGEFRDALDALERDQGVWRTSVTPIVPMAAIGGRAGTDAGVTPVTPTTPPAPTMPSTPVTPVTAPAPTMPSTPVTPVAPSFGGMMPPLAPSGPPGGGTAPAPRDPFAAPAAVLTPADATPLPLPALGSSAPPSPVPLGIGSTDVPPQSPTLIGSAASPLPTGMPTPASTPPIAAQAPAVAPAPLTTPAIVTAPARPTPAATPSTATPSNVPTTGGAAPRSKLPLIAAALGVVLVVGVVIALRGGDRSGTTGIAATSPAVAVADSAPARDSVPAVVPPATVPPAADSAPPPPAVTVDSGAARRDSLTPEQRAKAVADSLRAAKRDSLDRVRKDSVQAEKKKARALELAVRGGAERCVSIMDAHDMGALEQLVIGERGRILSLAKAGRLSATGPLNLEREIDGSRVTARFGALLRAPDKNGEGESFRASLRAILERTGNGDEFKLKNCIVDNDGGIR